jgi:hypothetical protein
MDIKETGWEHESWSNLSLDKDRWWVCEHSNITFQFHKMWGSGPLSFANQIMLNNLYTSM